MLRAPGGQLTYSDPYVAKISLDGVELRSSDVPAKCAEADCVVIVTDHSAFDYKQVVAHSHLVVDTRNVLKHFKSSKIIRL
jgi:UDP-N-acetyl-D-glucosamine dehydrogenase